MTRPITDRPAALLADRRLAGRGNGIMRQAAVQRLQQAAGNRATRRWLQRQAAPLPVQRVYLWDKSAAAAPHWVAQPAPPVGQHYLESGRYKDATHEEDVLYVRLGEKDVFYGLMEDLTSAEKKLLSDFGYKDKAVPNATDLEAFKKYAKATGKLDRPFYVALFGGKFGEDAQEQLDKSDLQAFYVLNPTIASTNDDLTDRCIVAMAHAIRDDGSVRFALDGMKHLGGILMGTKYKNKVTSHELKFAVAQLGKTVKVPAKNGVGTVNVPFTPNQTIFFYQGGEPFSASYLQDLASGRGGGGNNPYDPM